MNQLFPIVRRARRALLPADDVAPVVLPAEAEPPPSVPPIETLSEAVVVEAAPRSPAEGAPEARTIEPNVAAAATTPPKKRKRGANAPT